MLVGVDESSLTGESDTVYKVPQGNTDNLISNSSMIYAGTEIKIGKGQGIVRAIGNRTELGQINSAIAVAKRTSSLEKTPLTKKLNFFGNKLSLGICDKCCYHSITSTYIDQ